MKEQFSRTALLLGENSIEKLMNSRVAVFGIGGVGGFALEALVRAGIGTLDIIDNDQVAVSNLNRQIIATHASIGRDKVEVARERILQINPAARVNTYKSFFLPENVSDFNFYAYDYVVDAIDTVSGKIALVEEAARVGTPIISCMGAGNKLDPTAFEVSDIYKTSVCPLARVMRRELKKRHIPSLKVVYSKEKPVIVPETDPEKKGKTIPGSVSFVPSVAGLILAGEVIKDLCNL